MLLTGGIGDIITIESFLTDEERRTVTSFYYATRAYETSKSLFNAIPNFPNLKNHIALSISDKIYYSKEQVEYEFCGILNAKDGSISSIFNENRKYNGSSFLKYKLTTINPPKKPYLVICPISSSKGYKNRNFNSEDWFACIKILEKHDLLGVVLYYGEGSVPCHEKIVNLQNKTNILQSIEYIKASIGYIGIDSCLSVIAAKLKILLCIKSNSDHCWLYKDRYYAPRSDYFFLKNQIIPEFKMLL